MELTEPIDSLNRQLKDEYGIDSSTGQPMFRIVWSDDQRETRAVHDIGSIKLIFPVFREMPKYPYIKELYILERLVVIPPEQQKELGDKKLSYEPVWTFCTPARVYLPPTWPAAKFVIDTLYAALGHRSLAKYKEVDDKEQRVGKLQDELFGNETNVGDALAYKEGVVVPSNYEKES